MKNQNHEYKIQNMIKVKFKVLQRVKDGDRWRVVGYEELRDSGWVHWYVNGDETQAYNGTMDFMPGRKRLQYTNFTDRDGREIYDGDVVRPSWTGIHHRYVNEPRVLVKWEESVGGFPLSALYEYETLGNIYQNPEPINQ